VTPILALFLFALIVLVTSRVRPYDTYLSPVSVFGVAVLIYLVAIPVEGWLMDVKYLTTSGARFAFDEPLRAGIVLLGIVGYVAFVVGYSSIVNRRRRVEQIVLQGQSGHYRAVMIAPLAVSVIGALLLLLIYSASLLQAGTYAGNVAATSSDSGYALLLRFTLQSYAIWLFCHTVSRRSRFVSSLWRAAPLVAWGLYSSDKDPLIMAALGLSGWYMGRASVYVSRKLFAMVLTLAVCGIAIFTVIFSLYRGGSLDIVQYLSRGRGLLSTMEPVGPLRSVLTYLSGPGQDGYLLGESVLQGLVLWIPRAIWPDRPLDLSQHYAIANMSDWRPGMGLGFSLAAEGLMNGGWLGVAALFFVVGALFAAIRNWLLTDGRDDGMRLLNLATLVVIGFYVCFVSMRGPFSLIVTALVQSTGLWLTLAFAAYALRKLQRQGDGVRL
jgi:hypothetical protein